MRGCSWKAWGVVTALALPFLVVYGWVMHFWLHAPLVAMLQMCGILLAFWMVLAFPLACFLSWANRWAGKHFT